MTERGAIFESAKAVGRPGFSGAGGFILRPRRLPPRFGPMNPRLTSALFALLGLSAVLFTGSSAVAADMDASAKVLAKLDDAWSAAAGKRDANLTASYYADNAVLYPPNEPAVVGREAAVKIWTAMLADPTFTLSWKTLHAEVSASGDLGYTTGSYEDSYKGPDGKLVTEKGKYVCVWKKGKDGVWKAIHDTWNSDTK